MNIQKAGEQYYCEGSVGTQIILNCARCLETFETELQSSIDFIICLDAKDASEADVADSEDYVYLKGTDLRADVTAMVEQAVMLGVPLKPICKDECRGLCPMCGSNLNNGACSCEPAQTDSRWAKLQNVLNTDQR